MDRRLGKWLAILICGLAVMAQLQAAEPDAQVISVLRGWESLAADRGRDGWTVRSLQDFLGPVRETHLRQRFTWTLTGDSELTAVPTDVAEQQFLPSVRISIDGNGLPQRLVIGQRIHEVADLVREDVRQVAARESLSQSGGIVRASFNPGDAGSEAKVTSGASRTREVITRWVAASQAVNALRVSFRRVDYDTATEVESYSTGQFVYVAPHHGLYHSQPTPKLVSDSARMGVNGDRYVQLPRDESMLMWKGNDLIEVDRLSLKYETFPRPASPREVLGSGSFDATWQALIAPQSALPMVAGLQEKELRTNYEWELVTDDQKAILLYGTPIAGPDQSLYTSAQIVIDPITYRTKATRMIDMAGSKEVVHTLTEKVVSAKAADLGQWEPDLSKYEKVGEVPGVEAAPVVNDDTSAGTSTQGG